MDIKGRILVYSIVGCPHCLKAKSLLTQQGLTYTDVSVDRYQPQVRESVVDRTGRRTVPQIFFNDKHIGGNEELQALAADEAKWKALVEDIKETSPPEGAPALPDESLLLEGDDTDPGDFHCEKDEFAVVAESLKESGIIKTHWKGLTWHKATFKGSDLVNWLVREQKYGRDAAMVVGQGMLDNQLSSTVATHSDASQGLQRSFVDDDSLYRLIEEEDTSALNSGKSECTPRPASELGEEMRKIILKTYSQHLSSDGKKVDYKGIASSPEFAKYTRLSLELNRVSLSESTREEKLAFFINIYNALVIHANVVKGSPSNMWQRYRFFNSTKYVISGRSYSLQDIENGVLRANRKGVGMLFRPFSTNDPRLSVALTEPEPLIHFALVCGAKSCPPVKTYSADKVMEQLRLAAEGFLEGSDGCVVHEQKGEVALSKIFQWYRVDFAENNEKLVAWVHKTMADGEKKTSLGKVMAAGKFKVTFMHYDWSLNS